MFDIRRIGIVRRASAGLLDAILIAVLATGFMWIMSLICNFEGQQNTVREYYAEWDGFRKDYAKSVAEYYGFTYEEDENGAVVTIEKDGEPADLDDVYRLLYESKGEDEATREAYDAYNALIERTPVSKVDAQVRLVNSMLFMFISIGLLLSFLILEFIVPIFLKNGQTVGKKVFSICLVRPDCVKVSTLSLFARALLGKFAIEAMFPILLVFLFLFSGGGLVSVILFGAIILLNIILFFATRNKTPIHDILAMTVAADMKVQMIYASEEELNEKKRQLFLDRESAEKSAESTKK